MKRNQLLLFGILFSICHGGGAMAQEKLGKVDFPDLLHSRGAGAIQSRRGDAAFLLVSPGS